MTKLTKEKIEDLNFGEALSERYLAYALSTIMSRSLPDVRDGLKPVHRRLLYAMLQLKLDPKSAYKKCARVVGDVIGKYHPHGEAAVYDTLVRLAQDFSLRYPLIQGQGNFGSIDGDSAAAMRYTESRLTEIATYLLKDLDMNTVDFRATYDDSDFEPILFPASFPNLLANGSEGIAVGMATSIPPHNLHELCDALLHLINKPDVSVRDLMEYIKGPDFPTGGLILDNFNSIIHAYETGRGSFRVRARWHQESLSHGMYQIVITEIPYQVQKSRLIEKIADLLKEKKIPLIGNIRDESAEDIRIVIEPKNRSIQPDIIMESLFKLTELEVRISLNLNVIDSQSVPRVMNLIEVLHEFLAYKKNIVLRRSKFSLDKINARLEILEGLRIAYLNLDEIIKIIREEDEPKPVLMQRFALSDVQAESILNMRLRSLRKLEEQEILAEAKKLNTEKDYLLKVLNDEAECRKLIKKEIKEVQDKFGYATEIGKRRTEFKEFEGAKAIIDIAAFIEREPITVFCSKMGWIRALKGHTDDDSSIKYKEGDEERFSIKAYTTDKLLFLTESGRFYTILADNISKGKGQGESFRLLVDMEDNDNLMNIAVYKPGEKYLLASSAGKGFIVSSDDVIAQTKVGKQVLNVQKGQKAAVCLPITGDHVAIIGENRKLLIFKLDEIPEMKRGQGVTLQKYTNAKLSDIKLFKAEEGLTWKLGDRVRVETQLLSWLGRRGSVGKMPPIGFPRNNKFS
ncbi:MAG: parC [Rickettsiaceae bacterium]|jgi:topoisomerase-4 subunit A|nr:parC [Rickettsiaceae bacterium]